MLVSDRQPGFLFSSGKNDATVSILILEDQFCNLIAKHHTCTTFLLSIQQYQSWSKVGRSNHHDWHLPGILERQQGAVLPNSPLCSNDAICIDQFKPGTLNRRSGGRG